MKYNSLAAALICNDRGLRAAIFRLPMKELGDIEAKDDNLFVEAENLLSVTRMLVAAKEPTEDMPVKVDAIYFLRIKYLIDTLELSRRRNQVTEMVINFPSKIT